METIRANDLKAFRDFADAKLSNGGANLTLEEALDLWEYENLTHEQREETVQAIREGLDDMYAGRTRPANEVLAELRQKFSLGNR